MLGNEKKNAFSFCISLAYSYLCGEKVNMIMNEEDRLVKILQISHRQVLAGRSYTQKEVESFLDRKLYEVRDEMVGTCVAEPF